MNTTYKLVSDWNLKIDFTSSKATKGIVPVATDNSFTSSSVAGSYSISINDNKKYGSFVKSSTNSLFYFEYDTVVVLEQISSDGREIKASNPRLSFKSDGLPIILYYDLNTYTVNSVDKRIDGNWHLSVIDYVNFSNPINSRQISISNNGTNIVGSYILNFENTKKAVKYISFNESSLEWTAQDVAINSGNEIYSSTSIIQDFEGTPYLLAGSNSRILVYAKLYGTWTEIASYYDNKGIDEIDAVYDSFLDSIHISYISSGEVKYQKYNRVEKKFLNNYKFIDFNSSSISIDINNSYQPIISYSHIENIVPILFYLKIARGEEGGEVFKTYNVDSSSSGSFAGYLSDIVIDNDDKIYILYQNFGIKLYDEDKAIKENFILTTSWRDRRFLNNLIASENPPTRDSESTNINFNHSLEQYFYNVNPIELDESPTNFSIALAIIPSGGSYAQTIVSKSDSTCGYQIFMSGENGNYLGFSINTIYSAIEVLVCELPIGEISKIAFVYSGFDVKIYVKKSSDNSFVCYKYDIFGDVKKTDSPFVIGAYGIKTQRIDPYYYPHPVNDYEFSNYLNAKIINLKYWKRELSYEEASYNDSAIDYKNFLDPYSDNLNYKLLQSSGGGLHFILKGENLSVNDYDGISKIDLIKYSNYDEEERITNASGNSICPFLVKRNFGGMTLLFADKRTGYSEIYLNDFNSNNNVSIYSDSTSVIKSSGRNGEVKKDSNIFIDVYADFIKNGVYVGDFLNITSGTDYVGRKLPILNVINKTSLEIGAYCSKSVDNLGYYIDLNSVKNINDISVKITNLYQNSLNPKAVSDSINDLHVVWQSLNSENYDLYYQRYRSDLSSNQIWGSVKLTSKNGDAINPALAIDKKDVLHLVWEDTRNVNHSIMYGKSSVVTNNGNASFPYWNTSNFGNEDICISVGLNGSSPAIFCDNKNVVHIVFSAKSVNNIAEVYYLNNKNGIFSAPIKITSLNGDSKDPEILIDSYGNIFVIFNCYKIGKEDIYLIKYDVSDVEWKLPVKISSSENSSVLPSISIDSDNVIYAYWIEKLSNGSSIIGYAEYDTVRDSLKTDKLIRPSSSFNSSQLIVSALDDTKTIHISWEDSRDSIEDIEIYKNESINLLNFDEIAKLEESEKTDSEIIKDQLSRIVIGQIYPDDVSPSQLPYSQESLSDVILVFETDDVSYEYYVDNENREDPLLPIETIIMNSRKIRIKIKGISRTIAYRLRNSDDNSSYSEFYEFKITEFPNTAIADWILSLNNGLKTVCIQLYTSNGLTSSICVNLFLNEPNLYDVILCSDNGNKMGDIVSTSYQDVKVLTSKNYWVKIKPKQYLDETQKVEFDIITNGESILNNSTKFDGEYYIGKFILHTQDGIKYIDGNAKIIPKVVAI